MIQRNRFRRIIGSKQSYSQRLDAIPGINWWHKQELTGTTIFNTDPALNGIYSAVALGQLAQGDLGYGVGYDGVASFGNVYSLALNTFFNPAVGALVVFAKMSGAGVWTDGAFRRMVNLEADANNRILAIKSNAVNQVGVFYIAGGTLDTIVHTTSTLDWFMLVMTWDTVADELILYFNGVKTSNTQTGLGAWVGNLLSTATVIGAATTTPTEVMSGDEAHVGIANRALSAIEIWDIWQGSGLA